MTRIDFHFNVDHRVHYACRVTRKARAAGKKLVVYARSAERLAQYDSTLWTFSALDFLPHVYVNSPLAASTPIVLALDHRAAPASDDTTSANPWTTRALLWRFLAGDGVADIAEDWAIDASHVESALRNALRGTDDES